MGVGEGRITMPGKSNRPRMIRVTIRLPQDLWEKAKRLAAARGVSMSQVFRDLIDRLIDTEDASGGLSA